MAGDSNSQQPARLRIGLDPALAAWLAEVQYTLDTLLETAGYAREWLWAEPGTAGLDLYYGNEPDTRAPGARVVLPWSGRGFESLGKLQPTELRCHDTFVWPVFSGESSQPPIREAGSLRFASDLVFAAFWWLSGAHEPHYGRDRVDNLSLAGSFLGESGLQGKPWISLWAARLREHFRAQGLEPRVPEWGESTLAISHDVDYPEIVRLVELLRRPADARAIFAAGDPFWCFDAWADFAESLGTRSAFYFMARQGSLLRYLTGDPDAFYDVASPRFRSLLATLRERGCEIGLHASFRSSEKTERYAIEKRRVEEAAGAEITGNRQHYWRLDPEKPHESLAHLADAGFGYDSSLGFERMPGFRRGICHPYKPWHPERRAVIDLLEVPPAWMDDHYDGRLADSGISDPEAHAGGLLADVAASGGVAVVDYHVRGMNERFFPRWGAWLARFLPGARPSGMVGRTPAEIASGWLHHVACLEVESRGLSQGGS